MTPEQHAAVIRSLEGPMAEAYLAEVRAVESMATVAEIERLIAEDDREGLIALLSLGAMTAFFELWRSAFMRGATNELAGRWRFDSNDWAIINLLREESQLIRNTAEMDLRKTVDVVMGNRNTVRNKALDLIGVKGVTGRRSGGMAGLPVQMSEWVDSARDQLLSGDRAAMRAYLTRKLRDTAFDKFIEPGKPLTLEQANRVVRAYARNLLASYARQKGETSAAKAYESGRFAVVGQNSDGSDVKKIWRSMRDDRVRHSHVDLNGKSASLDQPFLSVWGNLMRFPHDTELGAGPEDWMNCRCTLEYKISRRF